MAKTKQLFSIPEEEQASIEEMQKEVKEQTGISVTKSDIVAEAIRRLHRQGGLLQKEALEYHKRKKEEKG